MTRIAEGQAGVRIAGGIDTGLRKAAYVVRGERQRGRAIGVRVRPRAAVARRTRAR